MNNRNSSLSALPVVRCLIRAYVTSNRDDLRCKAGALLWEIRDLLALDQITRDREIGLEHN